MTSTFGQLYEFNAGEGQTKHQHTYEHSHRVFKGQTFVEVEGQPSVFRTAADGVLMLPANLDHTLTAVENGTIYFNSGPSVTHTEPQDGGVLLVDGTVVR